MQPAEGYQRLSHHTGECLAAQDLQDDVSYDARMRGLHVRALHGVWGIALGFEVIPAADKKSLVVTQGMAYDCRGREIVLSDSLPIGFDQPPPGTTATAWWFDLLIRYDPTLGDTPINECSGIVRNAVPERPKWRWSYAGEAPTPFFAPLGFADDVRLGEEIPLARARITDQGTWTDFDLTVRRVARSLTRPHIATGLTRAGSVPVEGSPMHWRVRIDTSATGFNAFSPLYFASMSEHPLLSSTSGFADIASSLSKETKSQVLGPFTRIEAATRTGFTVDVQMATVTANALQSLPTAMQRTTGYTLPVSINWVGIEPNGGCAPPARLPSWFLASGFIKLLPSSLINIGLIHI